MATIHSPRHASISPHLMHSFFPSTRQDIQSQQHGQQHIGLDGSIDNLLEQPSQNDQKIAISHKDNPTSEAQPHPHNYIPSDVAPPRADYVEKTEIDLNDDRRKRRKVSDGGGVLLGNNDDLAFNDRPTTPVREIEADTKCLSRERVPGSSANQGEQTSLPTRRTPRRAAQREHDSDSNQRRSELTERSSITQHSGIITADTIPTPNSMTPKKKMLKLGVNGKLLDSPKAPTTSSRGSRPRKAKEKDDKGASGGGTVSLRDGKLTQVLRISLRYGLDNVSKSRIGQTIDEILRKTPSPKPSKASAQPQKSTVTHPFFLGKAIARAPSNISSTAESISGANQESDQEGRTSPKPSKPVPWKDIVFKTAKTPAQRGIDTVDAAWPPLDTQHVGQPYRAERTESSQPTSSGKQKASVRVDTIPSNENVLNLFAREVDFGSGRLIKVEAPQRLVLDSKTVIAEIDHIWNGRMLNQTISSARSHALTCKSAFDRAESPGPLVWSHQYAPSESGEVMQPSCDVLREWLRSLAVHNVKQGVDQGPIKGVQKKKGRPRKRTTELDDFIVEDDDETGAAITKNAILLVGPNGCGKTASVFAVAKELGFEVFEIHPGMRRSAKDILDKVGDMAQNHLVQRGGSASRSSSVPPGAIDPETPQDTTSEQPSVVNFFGTLKKTTTKTISRSETPQPKKKEQKQSLILFEEADILFDEDRGFWAGVQNLIKSSKRPVVLTCNDRSKIPNDEIDFHAVLEYKPPSEEVVTQYLNYVAMAEGHLMQPQALLDLYRSKHFDLRATMAELNFWCQMTVGSAKGGLDWFRSDRTGQTPANQENIRTFSKNTYRSGLDLYPQVFQVQEETLRHMQTDLDLDFSKWDLCGKALAVFSEKSGYSQSLISQFELITSCHSCMDLVVANDVPTIASSMLSAESDLSFVLDREFIHSSYIQSSRDITVTRNELFECLDPLLEEKPVFPPTQGRLAPSLDCSRSSLATDVAPYVRSILNYEGRLEEQKEALYGSQGKKTRNTRVARAAVEGGNIATMRPERWFHEHLNQAAVLRTGPKWPQWMVDDIKDLSENHLEMTPGVHMVNEGVDETHMNE